MQQGPHVALQADRIHEDEGPLLDGERRAVATGRFALAVVQVQQALASHCLKVVGQLWIDPVKDGRAGVFQSLYVGKRA